MMFPLRPFLITFVCLLCVSCGGGSGSKTAELVFTNRELDLSVDDETYMLVFRPDGTDVYTQSYSFDIGGDGAVSTAEGYVLAPGLLPAPDYVVFKVEMDGTVKVSRRKNSEPTAIGMLQAVKFPNPGGLREAAPGLFEETSDSGFPIVGSFTQEGFGAVRQGYLVSAE